MEKGIGRTTARVPVGDAVVNGLFAGLLAGAGMGAVIAAGSLAAGQGLGYLGLFAAGGAVSPLQGLLMHLAVSGVYGMLYALLHRLVGPRRAAQIPGWLTGLAYALLLWAFAVTILLPATQAQLLNMPWPVFLLGHITYGLILGARGK
jgi:hypothetical protein